MCDLSIGVFAIPRLPSAKIGWWVGRICRIKGKFVDMELTWMENPEKMTGKTLGSTVDYVIWFETEQESYSWLRARLVPVPEAELAQSSG